VPQVTFEYEDRPSLICEVREGESVLDAALDNGVPGIIGQCGGAATCLTCHCYVLRHEGNLPAIEALEAEVLEYVYDRRPMSRLACQLPLRDGLRSVVVRPAARQI